ncbi:hypothetical protein HHK36_026297 [Tetracentron sinense]|uniref:Pre-mRNA polyadenylation factor Fip1 domain-containing protein n=1 Tax=Tetracentron sinense TaxID=13715 RepID=A0A834YET3_TETSI|nr:hypothetical protein HHK36_026297 [Tetracentron sinense]
MEDLDDDFGDLYADVEFQVSAAINAIPSFNQLYIDQKNKNDRSIPKEGLCSDSSLEKGNSIREEDQENLENSKPVANGVETSVAEADGEKELVVDNGSESEDDLQIVLNDEDCRIYPIPCGANSGNEGIAEGSDEDEDEDDDDLVIVTEADHPSKERKQVDQLQLPGDGLEQGSAGSCRERGKGTKGSYHSQYPQYKYIRPHAAAFPSNTKANGSMAAISSYSPLSGRGDLEVNGCNQNLGSVSGQVASSRTTAHSGHDFSLPRYRTILDVSIETFERKPWRHAGVDITDYFNFGFNEENWKHYCNFLAYQDEFEHETVALDAVVEDVSQTGQGERDSPAFKIAHSRVRQFDIPRGRSIQVEGSISERRPSMDVRRPRNRDSDVVIQIAMQDSMDDSSGSEKEGPGLSNNSVHEASGNRGFDTDDNRGSHHFGALGNERSVESMDGHIRRINSSSVNTLLCPLARCSRPTGASNVIFGDPVCQRNEQISDVDGHHHQKVKEHASEKNTEAMDIVKQTKEEVGKNPSKEEPCILEAESSHGNQIQHSSSSSDLDSHWEASKAGVDMDAEETQKPARRPSSNSVTELRESITSDYYHSKDSESHHSKMEPGDSKDHSGNQSPILEDHNCCSRMRLRSVAELKNHVEDDEAFPMPDRKGWYNRDQVTVNRGRRKEGLYDYGFYDVEDLSYYKETEISIGYHRGRFTDKQRKNAYTEAFHRKGHQRFRDQMDPYLRRHWDEREYFLEQRISAEDNEIKQREGYFRERGHNNDGMNTLAYKESTQSVSEHMYFDRDKERYTRQRRKKDDEHLFRKSSDDDDFMLENRKTEVFIPEKYGRPVPYNYREEAPFGEKYERHVPYTERVGKISHRRERDFRSPSLDLDGSWRSMGHDDEYWKCTDHRSLSSHPYREPDITKGRGWHGTTSPRNDVYDSGRLDERYGGHWRQIRAGRYRESRWFGPSCKDNYDADDSALYFADQVHNERRRYSLQSEVLNWDEDESASRHRDDLYAEEASFSYVKSSRHEYIHSKHNSSHGGILDDDRLKRHRNKTIEEESRNSDFSNCISSSFDIIHRDKHEKAALRCRDSVDLHLVGGEGKVKLGKPRASIPAMFFYICFVKLCSCLPMSSCAPVSVLAMQVKENGISGMYIVYLIAIESFIKLYNSLQSSGKFSKAGNARCNGQHENRNMTVDEEQTIFMDSNEKETGKAVQAHIPKLGSNHFHGISSMIERVDQCDSDLATDKHNEKWLDKYPVTQHHVDLGLEEGELVVELENKEVGPMEKKRASENKAQTSDVKERRLQTEDATNGNKVVGGYDNHRILETLAKMEKRRERFKEPITLNKEHDKFPKPQCDPVVEVADVKQQRPARKRRWGGS